LILVMGHTNCGAVKAAVETASGADTGSPYINALVAEIQPRLAERTRGAASENLVVEGWDNALGVSQKLLEKSKLIRDAAKSGSLRVETALYNLKSGQVEWNR
jgi:carbonic anhydrase